MIVDLWVETLFSNPPASHDYITSSLGECFRGEPQGAGSFLSCLMREEHPVQHSSRCFRGWDRGGGILYSIAYASPLCQGHPVNRHLRTGNVFVVYVVLT